MPSPTEPNGRDKTGRFAAGNSFGKGNPLAQQTQKLRSAMFAAVSDKDIAAIVSSLVVAAKGGDTTAAREVLDRTIGKAIQADLLLRVEELEHRIEEMGHESS